MKIIKIRIKFKKKLVESIHNRFKIQINYLDCFEFESNSNKLVVIDSNSNTKQIFNDFINKRNFEKLFSSKKAKNNNFSEQSRFCVQLSPKTRHTIQPHI